MFRSMRPIDVLWNPSVVYMGDNRLFDGNDGCEKLPVDQSTDCSPHPSFHT